MKKLLLFVSAFLALLFVALKTPAMSAFYPYLPSMIGQAGKVLGTNGTVPSWVTGGGGGGPTLAANQTWTGVNSYTNVAGGLAFGTALTNQIDMTFQSGSNGFGILNKLGVNSTRNCGSVGGFGYYGDFLDFYDTAGGGDAFTINNANNVGFCDAVDIEGTLNAEQGIFAGPPATSVQTYPWHPTTAPSCTIGTGGTTCTTSNLTLPAAGMQCTANPVGSGTIGGVGQFALGITYPTTSTFNITATFVTTLVSGGTDTFSTICN